MRDVAPDGFVVAGESSGGGALAFVAVEVVLRERRKAVGTDAACDLLYDVADGGVVQRAHGFDKAGESRVFLAVSLSFFAETSVGLWV